MEEIEVVAFEMLKLAAKASEKAEKATCPTEYVPWWSLAESVTEAVSAATMYVIADDRLTELAEKADQAVMQGSAGGPPYRHSPTQ